MKRTIIQSLIFSAILAAVYYVILIARGYIMTINYVPDIVNAYESVDFLQQKTSFGLVNPQGMITELIAVMVIGIIAFVGVKVLVLRIKQK